MNGNFPNFIVPTPPVGDSSNRVADTQFVQAVATALYTALSSAIASAVASAVSSTQIDFISGGVAAPDNREYRVIEFVYFPMTLNTIAAKLSTGSVTAYLKINSSTVTGSTLSALGTTQVTSALTAVNTATTGDVVIVGISGTASSPANLSFAVKFTRQFV